MTDTETPDEAVNEIADAPTISAAPAADSFFDKLPKYFENHQIVNSFRQTKDGVFVVETLVEQLITAYQRWTREASGGEGKSAEKIRRRLFGDGRPKLLYALDGKRCLPGYVIQGEHPDSRRSKIPVYHANLLPTENELHPRDPFLQTVPGVGSRLTTHEGFVLEVMREGKKFDVTDLALRDLAASIRSSPELSAKYPEARGALRFALKPLTEILSEAKEQKLNERMLVPHRIKNKSGLTFLRSRGLTIVLEGRKITGFFSTKGKSLSSFLRREIEALEKAGENATPRGFAAGSQKKHCVGRSWSQGIAFHLHTRALLQFFKQAQRAPKIRKRIPDQFSVYDILERFVALFRNSKPIDELELLGKLRKREAFAKYRRTGSWLFVLLDKNVIHTCVTLKSLGEDEAEGDENPPLKGSGNTSPNQRQKPGQGPGRKHRRRRHRNNFHSAGRKAGKQTGGQE